MGVIRRVLFVYGLLGALSANAEVIPTCRLDSSSASLVEQTVKQAAQAYRELGKALPFDTVVVNPQAAPMKGRTLTAYIVTDANSDGIDANGCTTRAATKDDPLDDLSVRGGCLVVAAETLELRCSSSSVALFGGIGKKTGRANPALLYVLAHELGHVHQRQAGEYEGQVSQLDLAQSREAKLQTLVTSCDPVSIRKEEEADALAVDVMKLLLQKTPYREPLFSQRGSLLWNVDQLVITANAWQQASLVQEFSSRPVVHEAFVPTEFPTPDAIVEANARKFICDVMTGKSGAIYYPLQSATHPSLDQRMGRIAEAMRPISASLPNDNHRTQFESVAKLQGDLGPIFNQIYRGTSDYMEAVQSAICTMVNAPEPPICR